MSNIKNASIIVVTGNNYDRVLMVRDKNNHKWMFPGGKIDKGETSWEAAKREFEEETGFELPRLNGDKTTGELYKFIRTHNNGTQTKIYLGFVQDSSNKNDLYGKYDKSKVTDNETDEAYSVCFSSLAKNDFKYWQSSKHRGRQTLRSAEEHSMREMYKSGERIGEILRQITDRADNGGCGERRGERRPGGGGETKGGDGGGGGTGTRNNPIIIESNPNNIGFDIDGVLHRNVWFDGELGNAQGHPRGNIKDNLREYPYIQILERIHQAGKEGKNIFLITHNNDAANLNRKYLKKNGLENIPAQNLIIAGKNNTTRDKAAYIAHHKISEFYDDSTSVLAGIYRQLITSTHQMPDGQYYKLQPLKLWQTCPIVDKLNNPPCDTVSVIKSYDPNGGGGGGTKEGGRGKNKLWNCDECQSGGLTPYGVTLGHPISQNEKVEVFNCRGCTRSQETKGGRRKKTKRRKTKRRKTKRRKNKKRKKTRRRKHR
jgi:8-oxo-dGTP pyrophosphatase MutT (NUDIX family)